MSAVGAGVILLILLVGIGGGLLLLVLVREEANAWTVTDRESAQLDARRDGTTTGDRPDLNADSDDAERRRAGDRN